MWVSLTPISSANSSPARCVEVPAPDEAKLRLAGSFFSSAISSATVLTPRFGSTISTFGRKATSETGSKSLTGSYGRFLYRPALMACVLMVPPNSV